MYKYLKYKDVKFLIWKVLSPKFQIYQSVPILCSSERAHRFKVDIFPSSELSWNLSNKVGYSKHYALCTLVPKDFFFLKKNNELVGAYDTQGKERDSSPKTGSITLKYFSILLPDQETPGSKRFSNVQSLGTVGTRLSCSIFLRFNGISKFLWTRWKMADGQSILEKSPTLWN